MAYIKLILGLRKSNEHCQSDKLERCSRIYNTIIASGLSEQALLIDSSVLNNKIPCKDSHSHSEPNEDVNMHDHQILDIWFTFIRLLENEDYWVRQRLALDVQMSLTLERCGRCSHARKFSNQVEKVIALCFDHLLSLVTGLSTLII
ncbi:hypothetical protein CFP56_029219 [Quercus suber]|uniref:Uncharacterized protein n=1 Tax=Quercus suber TaxID=58331 RepID=A0AAW0MB85_QUESU